VIAHRVSDSLGVGWLRWLCWLGSHAWLGHPDHDFKVRCARCGKEDYGCTP
jgi:hypothetical protein